MKKRAILFRLNPDVWPDWEKHLSPNSPTDVWFITGRRKAEDIVPGIPAIVLGTNGLGIVAVGETASSVEHTEDPDWKTVAPEFQAIYKRKENRVRASLRRQNIPLSTLKRNEVLGELHRTARETTTWLDDLKYKELKRILEGS